MPLDAAVLRESLALVTAREPLITRRFYEILFVRYPQTRPLFSHNAADRQQQMLQEAIVAVVDHLDDASWLGATLRGMGAKHVGYGVTPEMYPWVGECLLIALAEIAGSEWTPRAEQAWADAYRTISTLMLEGAKMNENAAL